MQCNLASLVNNTNRLSKRIELCAKVFFELPEASTRLHVQVGLVRFDSIDETKASAEGILSLRKSGRVELDLRQFMLEDYGRCIHPPLFHLYIVDEKFLRFLRKTLHIAGFLRSQLGSLIVVDMSSPQTLYFIPIDICIDTCLHIDKRVDLYVKMEFDLSSRLRTRSHVNCFFEASNAPYYVRTYRVREPYRTFNDALGTVRSTDCITLLGSLYTQLCYSYPTPQFTLVTPYPAFPLCDLCFLINTPHTTPLAALQASSILAVLTGVRRTLIESYDTYTYLSSSLSYERTQNLTRTGLKIAQSYSTTPHFDLNSSNRFKQHPYFRSDNFDGTSSPWENSSPICPKKGLYPISFDGGTACICLAMTSIVGSLRELKKETPVVAHFLTESPTIPSQTVSSAEWNGGRKVSYNHLQVKDFDACWVETKQGHSLLPPKPGWSFLLRLGERFVRATAYNLIGLKILFFHDSTIYYFKFGVDLAKKDDEEGHLTVFWAECWDELNPCSSICVAPVAAVRLDEHDSSFSSSHKFFAIVKDRRRSFVRGVTSRRSQTCWLVLCSGRLTCTSERSGKAKEGRYLLSGATLITDSKAITANGVFEQPAITTAGCDPVSGEANKATFISPWGPASRCRINQKAFVGRNDTTLGRGPSGIRGGTKVQYRSIKILADILRRRERISCKRQRLSTAVINSRLTEWRSSTIKYKLRLNRALDSYPSYSFSGLGGGKYSLEQVNKLLAPTCKSSSEHPALATNLILLTIHQLSLFFKLASEDEVAYELYYEVLPRILNYNDRKMYQT
ncbi:uncharacterized protein BDR25DRAFT_352329 [Lindgomyces ingoldianus]|uniref:Uncharacterized protein n=1 Tax=Lindgomyces ingoldianus TaxID=673940 RepID=A0ACB6R6D7_9PLEO|nr:uncharacterized protein BDR25DRAFT_352329 [Lindgomyces ingoldianus]KAF2473857.1 hypothetical protein BDR25DRAFT_352329 [Lindgomyces ingoldianus]